MLRKIMQGMVLGHPLTIAILLAQWRIKRALITAERWDRWELVLLRRARR